MVRHLRRLSPDDEAGFGLAEVMVALSIVVLVAVLSAPVFLNALSRTANLGTRQTAVTVGSQQLEYVRSLKGSALVRNRPQSLVNTATANATKTPGPSPAFVDLSQDIIAPGTGDLLNYDPSASPTDGSGAAVPIVKTTTVNKVTYTVTTFIDGCNLASTGNICTRTSSTGSHQIFRITVDVAWPRTSGESCLSAPSGPCEYVVVDLRDPSIDPVFSRLAPPVFSSIAETYQGQLVSPVVVHPLEQVSLTLTGSNFQYNLSVQSGDPADVITLGTVTTTTISLTYAASSTVNPHTLIIANPDGGSVTVPVSVAQSLPTVSGVTPAAGLINTPNTLLIAGGDFFTDTTGKVPTVTLSGSLILKTSSGTTATQPFASSAGTVTMVSPSLLSVAYPASAFPKMAGYTSYQFVGSVVVANPDSDTSGGGTATYSNYTLSLL